MCTARWLHGTSSLSLLNGRPRRKRGSKCFSFETLEKHDWAALAVAYSGCEMHILDTCKPRADFDFYKTTRARDAIEINDADALYTKLPLGALGLEGELQRSGKLTVQTIITVQVKLINESLKIDQVHSLPGCSEATHVVQAVSIGAFQLRSRRRTPCRARLKAKRADAQHAPSPPKAKPSFCPLDRFGSGWCACRCRRRHGVHRARESERDSTPV